MCKRMENGYYISCYVSIDKECNLYDVSIADRHDQNMALWYLNNGDIELIAYWELERYTGIKHFNKAWYEKEQIMTVINQLLAPYNLTTKDIVHFYGTPEVDEEISYDNPTSFTYHNLCHLFSAIMLDSDAFYNRNILGLALDYGSDYETECAEGRSDFVGCVIQQGQLNLFPVQSPAALWSVAAEANHMGEGSLMALATASTCEIKNVCQLNRAEFTHIFSKKIWAAYEELTRPIRAMDYETFKNYSSRYDDRFTLKENKISAIMKIIQSFSIKMMDEQVAEIINKYGLDGKNLILAVGGGFCLNCPTNAYLLKKYQFVDFMVAPCINDGGQSLGIGLYEFYKRNHQISFSFGKNPFRGGRLYDTDWVRGIEGTEGIKNVSEFCADTAARDLLKDVVVWYEGAAEIGPRALGHRSLLGNAANPETKKRLNIIKQRESWRPVAPIVMEEEASKYFYDLSSSPFMLVVYQLREEYRHDLQTIMHLDGTARVQTVSCRDTELSRIYAVLKSIKTYTGYPIIGNTSLNDKGEPIIESPQRAIEFALEKGISIVYINGYRIELDPGAGRNSEYRPLIQYRLNDAEETASEYNPHQVSTQDIQEVFRKYRAKYNLAKVEDAKEIGVLADKIRNERLRRTEETECI